MKDLKAMPTSELMAYIEGIEAIDAEIDRAVRVTYQCLADGGVTEREKEEILDVLKKEAEAVEPARLKLVKEITLRFKRNFGISKGPAEIQQVINGLVIKFPHLGLTKSEIEIAKAKKKERSDIENKAKKLKKA